MGSKDSNYQVIYRYEPLPKFVPGGGGAFSAAKILRRRVLAG